MTAEPHGAARRFSAKTQRVRAIRRGQSPPSTRPFTACGKRRERKEMGAAPRRFSAKTQRGAGDPAGTIPAVHPPLLGLREATREERGGALPHAPAGGSSPCTRGTSCGRAKRRPRRRPGDSGGSRDSGQRAVARPQSAPNLRNLRFPFLRPADGSRPLIGSNLRNRRFPCGVQAYGCVPKLPVSREGAGERRGSSPPDRPHPLRLRGNGAGPGLQAAKLPGLQQKKPQAGTWGFSWCRRGEGLT